MSTMRDFKILTSYFHLIKYKEEKTQPKSKYIYIYIYLCVCVCRSEERRVGKEC